MATALPRPVQLKLEQTLGQWRHWQCAEPLDGPPQVQRLLGQGHSNSSVLVSRDCAYVVRIDGINPLDHGLHRQAEWRALHAAHRAGLAPRPCYFNPELGSLVCEFLAVDESSNPGPPEVAHLLRAIHRLPGTHHRLDLRERIARYERALVQRNPRRGIRLNSTRARTLACLQRRLASSTGKVLCHNDLLRANRIYSGGNLRAIDWEYSAMAEPWYDLAVVICGDDLPPHQQATLLAAYLGREPDSREAHAIRDYAVVYRYLELLWYLAQNHPAMDAPRETEALRRLSQAIDAAEV
jgi:aminoglycoside phosphotransferase (APT) family kinase protein